MTRRLNILELLLVILMVAVSVAVLWMGAASGDFASTADVITATVEGTR